MDKIEETAARVNELHAVAGKEQVLLKDGPLNGTRVNVEPGTSVVPIAERAGPPMVRSRSMPPELIVAAKVGEYRRHTGSDFMWTGWAS